MSIVKQNKKIPWYNLGKIKTYVSVCDDRVYHFCFCFYFVQCLCAVCVNVYVVIINDCYSCCHHFFFGCENFSNKTKQRKWENGKMQHNGKNNKDAHGSTLIKIIESSVFFFILEDELNFVRKKNRKESIVIIIVFVGRMWIITWMKLRLN